MSREEKRKASPTRITIIHITFFHYFEMRCVDLYNILRAPIPPSNRAREPIARFLIIKICLISFSLSHPVSVSVSLERNNEVNNVAIMVTIEEYYISPLPHLAADLKRRDKISIIGRYCTILQPNHSSTCANDIMTRF